MEFHISDNARKKYDFKDALFTFDGNVIFADLRAVREFTAQINAVRAREGDPRIMSVGEMNALGLLDEILHAFIEYYRRTFAPELNEQLYTCLCETLGAEKVDGALADFCTYFPPLAVVKGEQTVEDYLEETNPEGQQNRYDALEELLLLWVTNRNPAAMKLAGELFDEKVLAGTSDYNKLIPGMDAFFRQLPTVDGLDLIRWLRRPALEHPDSLFDQLDYIRHNDSAILGDFLCKVLLSIDLMKEEYKDHGFGAPGTAELPSFGEFSGDGNCGDAEYEAFSPDSAWMPRLVLIAKNAYVWLDQLSKKYDRQIRHLDDIPDTELQLLAEEGFTGLWLIGLWERSQASQTIKQWCGNPEALASAYSLRDYSIAEDLGGEESFYNLRSRAWQYGIRMASDMVPNHMGIDSDWVLYHPDRFLSLDYSPYPSYTFNCGNLSPDPNIGIRIEDHYFSRNDAAVVFQRVDYRTGEVRYIYHGNDGTTMPWNDTAQLNYLNPEVRETVIQTILQVAKHTPIIRFDAAMTLAKKQYQRLWFPEPGSGGDIPSRAEHGLTKEEFDAAFPMEFWREVVDRVAAEAPGTLLLAEAFWLMESYFVRTLGMHRVYNSAFMNMLRDEDNVRYRTLLKTTLEFDPEILQRYVNFMNNPDERTAIDQFGSGDKYFGICLLMATMPGLPMFGHGQLEGFSEKYGMEYKKAYWDESVNTGLLQRHQQEIFPLLHIRERFSGADSFVLYNFANPYGNVDENVYAYSNYGGGVHSLVVYNNHYGDSDGSIHSSVNFVRKVDGEKIPSSTTLGESLGLHDEENYYVVLHDLIRSEDFVRSSRELCEKGLILHLSAYQYYAFTEVYEIQDDAEHTWQQLCQLLNGAGTSDLMETLAEIRYGDLLNPYRGMTDGKKLRWLYGKIGSGISEETWQELRNGTWDDFRHLAAAASALDGYKIPEGKHLFNLYLSGLDSMLKDPASRKFPEMEQYASIARRISEKIHTSPILWTALMIAQQERILTEDKAPDRPNIHEEWHLNKLLLRNLRAAEWFDIAPDDQVLLIQWLYFNLDRIREWRAETLNKDLDSLLRQEDTQRLLKVNSYNKILWFNKEASDILTDMVRISGPWLFAFTEADSLPRRCEAMLMMNEAANELAARFSAAEYQYDRLFSDSESEKNEENEAPEK